MKKLQNFFLYLYAFIIPFEYWNPFGLVGTFSIVKMVGLLYIISCFTVRFSFNNYKYIRNFINPLILFVMTLTLVNSLTIFTTYSPDPNILNLALIQNILMLYLITNHVLHDEKLIVNALLSFCLGIVLLGVLYLNNIGVVYRVNRVSIFGDNPNNQGTKVAIGVVLLVYSFLRNFLNLGKLRILYLIPIPFLFQFLIDTASRGALFSMLFGVFVVFLLNTSQSKFRKILYFLVAILTTIYVLNVVMNDIVFANRFENENDLNSLGGRLDIWENTINIFLLNPFFGVGENFYSYQMSLIYGAEKSAHNYYLYVLVTTGIIGLIIFSSFLFRNFKSVFFLYKLNKPIYFILFFEILFAMSRQGGALGDKFYWFLFALISGAYIYNKKLKSTY